MSDLGGITAVGSGSDASSLFDLLSNPQGSASDLGYTAGSSAAQGALDTFTSSLPAVSSLLPWLVVAAAVVIFASSR